MWLSSCRSGDPFVICRNIESLSCTPGKNIVLGFPGGSVVKNPPLNAGDTGSIPELGRSHMLRSNEAPAPQLLSLCSRTWEAQLLKCVCPGACAPQQEKALQWEAHTSQLESSPHSTQLEKRPHSNEDPAQPKINKWFFKSSIVVQYT